LFGLRGAGRSDHDIASTSVNVQRTLAFSASVLKQDGQMLRQRLKTTKRQAASGLEPSAIEHVS
jgi:hypothetical protein